MKKPYPECRTCALRDEPLVGAVTQSKATIAIVGEAPGRDEVERGKPFVGRSGKELQVALGPHLNHYRLHVTNAVLCRPPDNDLKRVRAQAKKRGLVDPVKACRGRLQAETAKYKNIITLGASALESIAGLKGIQSNRGFPLTLRSGQRVLPTVHPAFVLRSSKYRHVFRSDISKAFRYFSDALRWKLPKVVFNPSAAQVEAILKSPIIYADVETDSLEPLKANLRCLGIGNGKVIAVIPYRSVQGGVFMKGKSQIDPLIRKAVRERVWSGHNFGYYDLMVMEHHFNCKFTHPIEDTILDHHCTESELPHSLAYLGSVHTDITSWKEERHGLDYETDEDLWQYNAKDVAVSFSIREPLRLDVQLKEQSNVRRIDGRLQALCVDLHRVGIAVDARAVARHARTFQSRSHAALSVLRARAGADFNPASTQQVGNFLFDDLKLPFRTEFETDTGARGTGMPVIRALLVGDERTPEERTLLKALHTVRRAQKFRKTFIESMVPFQDDGRVHVDFNAHGTVSGRLSAKYLQQMPQEVRDIFIPASGHVFVAADMDQIELRMAAALAGAGRYLAVFETGADPHALTSDLIYGPAWRQLSKDEMSKLRDFAKRFSYACLYGAGNKTVLEVMRAVEDKQGGFPYLNTTIGEVIRNQRAWLGANPEFERNWDAAVQRWRENGFLADRIHGRKRFFLDGLDRNAMCNYEVQATSAALVHDATFELQDDHGITLNFDGPGTGIVYQGHDQLIVECRQESAQHVKRALTTAMNRTYKGLPVKFTSTAKSGISWKELK